MSAAVVAIEQAIARGLDDEQIAVRLQVRRQRVISVRRTLDELVDADAFAEPVKRPKRSRCFRGHRLTANNVYVRPSTGKRQCATCKRTRDASRDRAARAA